MNKLTSEMESTHKIWLGHGRINRLRPLARQTISSPYILPIFPKTGWAGFQSFLCILRVLALIKPRWDRFSAHSTHVQCLTVYRTCVRSPHRSRTQNCEKTRFARSEVKGLVRVKFGNFNYYSFVTQTLSFPSVLWEIWRCARCN